MAIVAAAAVAVLAFVRRLYVVESVLVTRGLGVQLTSSGPTVFSRRSSFVPVEHIESVILHEGFHRFAVVFYMAVVVKGRDRLQVVFPTLLPRREPLEAVWRDVQKCLY
ncbi:GPI-GlcNAc transferase complex, PIG-H component-domain-containing protein [Dipodascopsis tothii]|uniref:GPI-GlcNAc transferase complex, PIG-H component-domain-containing protein n=1 Tax=Dipodascopsis tothii TaxID=44089 RepID=UPI0034CFE61E